MLELRRRGFTSECGVCAGLPVGWSGSEEDSGPLAWRRVARGPAVTLAETAPLVWEIFHPEGEKAGLRPEVERHALFQRHSRTGALPRGDFQGVNCLGVVELAVRFGSERQSVFFEVVSTKFGRERDFERMTQDIAAKCGQLLLQWNTPSGVPFTSDPERRRHLVLELRPPTNPKKGAEEDLGVPIEQNRTRMFLVHKLKPMTYGQMAISPYVAETLQIGSCINHAQFQASPLHGSCVFCLAKFIGPILGNEEAMLHWSPGKNGMRNLGVSPAY